ncbi:MAG: pentapeptide repeat-containing protein [Cetobacterium sp.]|uniref:pentapeptide repeat-containing protein n=1 Tax=Bacteria TaxID=2 RepID=UPI002FCC9845
MFEKIKEKLFNVFYKNKAKKIQQMQDELRLLDNKKNVFEYNLMENTRELDDIKEKYEANKEYIITGAEARFEAMDNSEKQQVIDRVIYVLDNNDDFSEEPRNLGKVNYINTIKNISGFNMDSDEYIRESKELDLYKNSERISSETWDKINSRFFAEMTYKEGNKVMWLMKELKEEKIETAKNLLDRSGMERYFERNNIATELRDNYDFINLINANLGLGNMSYNSKELYESSFDDGVSVEETEDFERNYTKEEKGKIYKEFLNSQEKARENIKKYDYLLNFVNKEINKIVGKDIEKIDERFSEVNEFKTNKELQFEDGSIVKEGTSFIIEGFLNDFGYKIHFGEREGNIYNRENGTGEGYYLEENKLVEFAQLEEIEIHDKIFIKDGVDFFGELEKDLNLKNRSENFFKDGELNENVYVYYEAAPDECRLISSVEEFKDYIIEYMEPSLVPVDYDSAEDIAFEEEVKGRWSSKDIIVWCQENHIEISNEELGDDYVSPYAIEEEKPKVIGKVDYFDPNGDIAETIEYTDSEKFRKELNNCIDNGVPIKVSDYSQEEIYKNILKDGSFIQSEASFLVENFNENPSKEKGGCNMLNSKKDEQEVIKMIKEHEEWIASKGVRGKQLNLSNEDLRGIKLLNVDLRESNLKGADISGCIIYADLRGANLTGTKIDNTKFTGSNLNNTTMEANNLKLIEYQIKEESDKHKLGLKNLKTNKEKGKEK